MGRIDWKNYRENNKGVVGNRFLRRRERGDRSTLRWRKKKGTAKKIKKKRTEKGEKNGG